MTDLASDAADPPGKQSRDQSTIQFPYGDLNDAVIVSHGIMKCGGTLCDPDQLAAAINQVPTSGSFRLKVATARIFGAIETVQGRYKLTDLGFALTDKAQEKAARAEAFLRVPLYRRVYEEFRNRQLPPRPAALERAFIGFGVAPKQGERARHAFDRSAQQAGYFEQAGKDRLIKPPTASLDGSLSDPNGGGARAEADQDSDTTGRAGAGGGGGGAFGGGSGGGSWSGSGGSGGWSVRGVAGLHPFVQGLLDTLPEPETNWAVEGRAKWLQAAANIFDLMYKGDGDITVKAEKNRATGS